MSRPEVKGGGRRLRQWSGSAEGPLSGPGFWKEVHFFATPPIAKAIAQARDEERLPILVLPIQVLGA